MDLSSDAHIGPMWSALVVGISTAAVLAVLLVSAHRLRVRRRLAREAEADAMELEAGARFHRQSLLLASLSLALLHGFFFLTYDLRLLVGERVHATVTSVTYRRGGKGRGGTSGPGSYEVRARRLDGRGELYDHVAPGFRPHGVVPFIVVPGWPAATQIGARPTLLGHFAWLPWLILGSLAGRWYRDRERAAR